MIETFFQQKFTLVRYSGVPIPIAIILAQARMRALQFAVMEHPSNSPEEQKEYARKMLWYAFSEGIDIARRRLSWNEINNYPTHNRRTVRIYLSEEDAKTVERLMNMCAISRNAVITESIMSATYNNLNATFRQ